MTNNYSNLIDQYYTDGFVILRDVIDAQLIQECREHVEFLQKKFPSIPGEHLHHPIMRNDPFWIRLVSDPRLLDLVSIFGSSFIGSEENIALFSSHYFCKPAKTGMPVLWHQDGNTPPVPSIRIPFFDFIHIFFLGSYWPLKPMNVLTMWLAIDDSDTENGCLQVVRGSHREELAKLNDDISVQNVLGSYTHRDQDIDPEKVVDIVLKPGGKCYSLSVGLPLQYISIFIFLSKQNDMF